MGWIRIGRQGVGNYRAPLIRNTVLIARMSGDVDMPQHVKILKVVKCWLPCDGRMIWVTSMRQMYLQEICVKNEKSMARSEGQFWKTKYNLRKYYNININASLQTETSPNDTFPGQFILRKEQVGPVLGLEMSQGIATSTVGWADHWSQTSPRKIQNNLSTTVKK